MESQTWGQGFRPEGPRKSFIAGLEIFRKPESAGENKFKGWLLKAYISLKWFCALRLVIVSVTHGSGMVMVTSFNSMLSFSKSYSILTSHPDPVSFGQQLTAK